MLVRMGVRILLKLLQRKRRKFVIFEKIYFLIKQKFCKHRFRKHFDTHKREYSCKCVKCGKTMTYDAKGY